MIIITTEAFSRRKQTGQKDNMKIEKQTNKRIHGAYGQVLPGF
jgi:hypothetical protein